MVKAEENRKKLMTDMFYAKKSRMNDYEDESEDDVVSME